MLPDMNLDVERFKDIVEEAKNKISALYPEWTDYNYHDPGITLIELFAWLKEIQQFFMNQNGIRNREGYLKLLGIRVKHQSAAAVRVNVKTEKDCMAEKGTRLYAGDIIFETTRKHVLLADNISKIITGAGETLKVTLKDRLEDREKLQEYPFGKDAGAGNIFYIGFAAPLPKNETVNIFMNVEEKYKVMRNPVGTFQFIPLADISYEYFSGGRWKKISYLYDETHGFIQDGGLSFSLEEDMEKTQAGTEEGFFLRAVLHKSEYDMPPVLTGISTNVLEARQEETLVGYCDYPEWDAVKKDMFPAVLKKEKIYLKYDGRYYEEKKHKKREQEPESIRVIRFAEEKNFYFKEADGLPCQQYTLEDSTAEYEAFQIMIADREETDAFYDWKKVTDFFHSKPEDRHYIFEEETGSLRFGDGQHGLPPAGRIYIIHYVRTHGSKGNVKPEIIDRLDMEGKFAVKNEEEARNGSDTESMEDALKRFKKSLQAGNRLITAKDYETAVKQTPGLMIHSCKILNQTDEPHLLEIVVKPYTMSAYGRLNSIYIENILNFLESRRMLGTEIKILAPVYIDISLYAQISIKPYHIDGKKQVEQAVRDFFEARESVFGMPVLYSDIYSTIDLLDCVSQVDFLSIDAGGEKVKKSSQGNLLIPPYGLSVLKEIRFIFNTADSRT